MVYTPIFCNFVHSNYKKMENLPKDPIMLFSYVNTMLRDRYESLAQMCDDLDISQDELEAKLKTAGFIYNPSTNQFR